MFSIYGAVLLSFVFVTVTAVFDKETCRSYGKSLIECCMNEYPETIPTTPDDISECNSKDIPSCERDLCEAKKMGFTSDDGKIDKAKVVDVLFERIKDDQSLMEDVKSKCINGDIEAYASTKACDSEKIIRCITTQWLKHCTKWNDSSSCQQFKGFVKKEC